MSIVRGINRRQQKSQDLQQYSSTSQQLKRDNSCISRSEYDKIMSEIKHLMKENTKLKQQNLQLKQQIMLSKIQYENVKMKNEEMLNLLSDKICQMKEKDQIYQKKCNKTRKMSNLTQKIIKIDQYQKPQNSYAPAAISWRGSSRPLNIIDFKDLSIATQTQSTWKDKTLGFKKQNKPTSINNCQKAASTKLNRKQQIMNKYKPFLNSSESEQDSIDTSSLI